MILDCNVIPTKSYDNILHLINVQYIHFLFTRCEISKMESQNHLIQSFVYMYSFNVYLQNCNIWSKIISLQDNYYSAWNKPSQRRWSNDGLHLRYLFIQGTVLDSPEVVFGGEPGPAVRDNCGSSEEFPCGAGYVQHRIANVLPSSQTLDWDWFYKIICNPVPSYKIYSILL